MDLQQSVDDKFQDLRDQIDKQSQIQEYLREVMTSVSQQVVKLTNKMDDSDSEVIDMIVGENDKIEFEKHCGLSEFSSEDSLANV